jgi:hypothetical protein
MKSFFKMFFELCDAIGQARAATVLTRAGKVNEAKALYGK